MITRGFHVSVFSLIFPFFLQLGSCMGPDSNLGAPGSVSGKELCLFAILLGIGTLAVSPVRAEHILFNFC